MTKKQPFGASAGKVAAPIKRRRCCPSMTTLAAMAVLHAGISYAVVNVPPTLHPPDNVESWLMFDGVCNLCDGFVNFVADGDSQRRVKFGAQQRHEDLLRRVGAPTDLSTVVLIQGDKFYTKSTAALRTLALMDWPYRALSAAHVLPQELRDVGYGLVAKYRYKVFGKVESCRVPSGEFRKRFIDYRPEEEGEANPISGKKA